MNRVLATVFALAVLGLAGTAWAGSISGMVKVDGDPGRREPAKILKDAKYCGDQAKDLTLVVAEGGALANAVVSIENIEAPSETEDPELESPRLDQIGCRFQPHVLAAQTGTRLKIKNSDPILHNVHAREGKKTHFNLAFPIRNQELSVTLRKPGILKLGCDAGHTWMASWVLVFPHRYFAVSAADGSFHIPDVPPGSYNLVVWHERLGTQTLAVEVADAEVTVNASFAGTQEGGDEEKAAVDGAGGLDGGGL